MSAAMFRSPFSRVATFLSSTSLPRFTQYRAKRLKGWPITKPKLKPSYRGIYKTEGDFVIKNEVLVRQYQMNYHPGLNVLHIQDHKDKVLRAMCNGTVLITREKVEPDFEQTEMEYAYGFRKDVPLYKLTFNVVPPKEIGKFKLVDVV